MRLLFLSMFVKIKKLLTMKDVNFTLKSGLFIAACLVSMGAYSQTKPNLKTKTFGKTISSSVYCGSTEYEALLQKKNPKRSTANFEKWIAPKAATAKTKRLQKNGQGTNDIVTIPVVFHIIHNGSALGTAENIADAQVISQITVLNEDFRRLEGSNGDNSNPVGADTEINFCLAKRDPAGVLSTGITRHALGNGQGWSVEEVEVIKAQTQWDPEKYLNIWVFDIIQGLAGYAQFPQESGLEGLDGGSVSETANTDGVALSHNYVGSIEIYPQGQYSPDKNLGRTASHEIGHFLGLRHIWGDLGSCDATDYCDDTPAALTFNQGCPENLDSCPDNPGLDMIENYMDYTNDACQNIFTLNQKDRMRAVLANSPRRHSLITSDGCTPGMVYDNDGSLNINGINGECGVTDITPGVTLTNSGNNTLTSITFTYKLDEGEEQTHDWTGSLTTGQSTIVTLPTIATTAGSHTFSANIITVNGVEDQAPSNDDKTITFKLTGTYATNKIVVTIQTDNYGDETYWILGNYESDEVIGGNLDAETGQILEVYESNRLYTFTLDVGEDGCYLFAMLDAGQDGICCLNGDGYYKIETAEGVLITEGGSFTVTDQRFFAIDSSLVGNKDINKSGDIKLYPNPANNILNISVTDVINMPDTYTVYNSLGQVMDNGSVTAATQNIDIARYANGVYFIKLSKGDTNTTLQFIKQ